jgi:hypothetical protein
VQDPNRGDVQETFEDFKNKGSEVQDSPDRGEVQDSSEKDFENK